jgi:cysteine synthase A
MADSRPIELRSDEILDGVSGLIGACPSSVDARVLGLRERILYHTGNTPLVRINSLSDALGVEILGKAEVRQGC